MNKRDHILNGILLGVGLGVVLHPQVNLRTVVTMCAALVPVVLGTMFPDIDTEFGTHRKTLHNVFVLAVLYAYTVYFGNLAWVWVGVVSHLVLDYVGSKRGVAFFYPVWDAEFGTPVGVTTTSRYAGVVTVVITAVELAVIYALVQYAPAVIGSTDLVSQAHSFAVAF